MRKSSDGLVIRECSVGESDKLITVLTAENGKILISAKGVRSKKSKNTALCRLFTYANFEYYEKNGRYWLADGLVSDSFFGLGNDIEALALASYVVDLVNEISGENSSDELLLRATLNTLYAIQNKLRPYEQIKGAFEFFAAAHSGFLPNLSCCERCGSNEADSFCLDVMNGSLLCSECIGERKLTEFDELPDVDRYSTKNILLPVTAEVILAINYAISAPVQRLFSFSLSNESDISLFSHAGEIYLQNHLERGFDTLTFYRSLANIIAPKKQ